MEVRMESEEVMEVRKRKGKRRRPNGPQVPTPSQVIQQLHERMQARFEEWIDRMASEPIQFAEIELEIHREATRHAGLLAASVLAKASERDAFARKSQAVIGEATAPLGAVEKKAAL